MKHLRQWILAAAALLGFAGVLFAAAGSHWVEGLDDPARYRQWQAAVLINLVHALALLAIASHELLAGRRLALICSLMMLLGTVLFSGSIYLAMMAGSAGPGRVAPTGGMLLLLGWLMLFGAAFGRRTDT